MANIRSYTVSGILIFLSIVLICAAAWAFWQVRAIFLYLLVAAILTVITRPVEKKLAKVSFGKRKMPGGVRALTILLGIYLVIYSFIAIFVPLFVNQTKIISNVNTQQLTKAFHEPISQIQNAFGQLSKKQSDTTRSALPIIQSDSAHAAVLKTQTDTTQKESFEKYLQNGAAKLLEAANITSIANGIVSFLGSLVIAFFAISFFTFFFIKDGPSIMEMLLLLVPVNRVKNVRNIIEESQLMLRKYFTGVLIDVVFVATFVSIGLAILGVKNAFIIGVFAGVMNIVPYVGPLIGGAFAIVIGVSSNLTLDFYSGLLPLIEKIILIFVAMNLTDAFVVQPYIFSNRVKAHPIEIFLVVLVTGTIAGIGGMIAAVPLYTIIRIIAKEFLNKYRFVQRLTDELEEVADPNHVHHPKTPE
ncbi:MAG TPA: AI-2E family transporter [Bacteroidia bacterium]|nr:AI-2E family transporter [Bacteroidia bacterium]